MVNEISYDVCKRLTENYNNNTDKKVSFGKVLGNFKKFTGDSELSEKYHNVLDDLYYGRLSKNKSIDFVNALNKMYEDGFQNPFYDGDGEYDENNVIDSDDNIEKLNIPMNPLTKTDDSILGVKIWDSNVNGKIMCRDGKMYSGVNFIPGDIVEECPIKPIDKLSMCARDVRDLAFELIPDTDMWGIPYGYANIYKTSIDGTGNLDYSYDPKEGIIRFYAIQRIKPNDELILRVGEE